jgi:hypothetical protein
MQLKPDDVMLFDIAASTMLAAINPHLMEPIWVYIIGPPSSGKTEAITPYEGCAFTEFVSTMTENTLASGFRDDDGKDPSILPLLNGRVLVVPDVSPLINDSPLTVMKIWGDLRDAYDGMFTKGTGTTGLVKYKSRFGVIMCATGIIDSFVEEHQQLGERFLSFRIQRVPLSLMDRFKLGKRVKDSVDSKKQWKAHLRIVVEAQMERAKQFVLENPGLPTMTEEQEYVVIMIANYLAMLRTSPVDMNAESAELPSRLVQQLLTVGHAHAMMDGRMVWDETDVDLVRRIGVDTFPIAKRRLVQALYNRGERRPFSSRKYLLTCSRMDKGSLDKTLMQYEYMRIVDFDVDNKTQKILGYRLTQELYEALKSTSFFEGRHMPG